MLRYGLYTRKSDDDRSVTEKSIGEQRAACETIVGRDALHIAKVWEESRTAKIPGQRPGWQELIKLVYAGEINAIICWHINRLVRNMLEGGELVQLLVDGRIQEIRTPHATYRPGDNILPLVIEAASATQYSRDLSNTVKRSMDGNFRNGNCNHRAPQGYRNARNPQNLKRGIIERDPERFDAIRKGWDLMLLGTWNVSEVIDHINDVYGYRTRLTKKKGGKPLVASTGYGMFRNPFYAGLVRYKGVIVHGNHDPMISVDEFVRVQHALDKEALRPRLSVDHAFTGLMICCMCGYQVTAEQKKLRSGQTWSTYHCCDPRNTCTKQGIAEAGVRRRISRELSSLTIEPWLAEMALKVISAKLNQPNTPEADTKHLERSIALVDERLNNLEEMGLSGLVRSKTRYQELEQRELKEKERLTLELWQANSERSRMRLNVERALRFAAFSSRAFEKAAPVRKREIARALADKYVFDGKKKTIHMTVAPIFREAVLFSRTLAARIEPLKTSSWIQKEPTFVGSVPFGGPCEPQIDLPESLLSALKGQLLPELSFEETERSDQFAWVVSAPRKKQAKGVRKRKRTLRRSPLERRLQQAHH